MLEFLVLGPFVVRVNGTELALGGSKPSALLAMLALHANQALSPERLAVALWGEDAPPGAVKTVHVYVHRLRRALDADDVLVTTAAGYRLQVSAEALDLHRFEHAVAVANAALAAGEPARAATRLREALGLWRGPALSDLAGLPFAPAAIEPMEEQRVAALELRLEADLRLGRHAELIPELRRLTRECPWRERLHGQLMLALYRGGRQEEALEVYRFARTQLVERIGAEPSPTLRRLHEAILRQDPSLELRTQESQVPTGFDRADEPPSPERDREHGGVGDRRTNDKAPAAGSARPALAPSASPSPGRDARAFAAPPTVTVGREKDLGRLRRLVSSDVRLVTLVGPGGVGKTRLALELARTIANEFQGGACMVHLADVRAAEDVASAIAVELGVAPTATEQAEVAVTRHLSSRESLLVLDNLEHLLDASPLIARLANSAPSLTIVATSREPLRLQGERTFPVDPLSLPPLGADGLDPAVVEAPAVRLFLNSAMAAEPAFAMTTENSAALIGLCRRLDGLPLALELAAKRVTLLPPADILRRLERDQSVLGRGPRDAPGRHQTLQMTLQWSFDLLSDAEQAALARLSVFAGGCELMAAETVTGASLDILHSLVDKHMVVAASDRLGAPRVFMLETVRQFARERLTARGDVEDAADLHLDCYLAFAEGARPQLERTGAPAVVAQMSRELDNIRAALRWALSRGNAQGALRLVLALQPYWCLRAELEGIGWLRSALAEVDDNVSAPVLARALAWHGVTLAEEAAFAEAESITRRSVEMHRECSDIRGLAEALTSLAKIILFQDRSSDALGVAKEAVTVAEDTGEPIVLARALAWQASAERTLPLALSVGDRAASLYIGAGNIGRLVDLKSKLSYIAISHGDYDAALELAEQALDAAHESGIIETFAQGNLGLAALLSGDPQLAANAFRAEIATAREEPLLYPLHEALRGLAAISALEGDPSRAAMLLGAVDTLRTHELAPVITAELEQRFYGPARTRATPREWKTAYDTGRRLSLDEALEAAIGVRVAVAALAHNAAPG